MTASMKILPNLVKNDSTILTKFGILPLSNVERTLGRENVRENSISGTFGDH